MTGQAPHSPSRRSLLGASFAAGLLPASAAELLAQAALFPTPDALRAAPPAPSVDFAFLLGVARPGLGAALFHRVSREPFHGGKICDRNQNWWALLPGEVLSAAQFGAQGDGQTDDAPALQAAIDYALYVAEAPKIVMLPPGIYRTDDALQIGRGDRYVTLELRGAPGEVAGRICGIYPHFNDRPGLNIQGGRRVRLHGLSLFGLNRTFLRANYEHFPDRSTRSAWLDPALGQRCADRHSPYAGIAIDAFSGPTPDQAYPAPKAPSLIGASGIYGKSFSSDTVLQDCRIEGFYIGLAVQPGQVPDASNGDFVALRDCDLSYNVIAIADGHPDSRCNRIDNCRLHFCHTAIDSLSHGPGAGSYQALISNSSFDNVAQIFNIDLAGAKSQGPYPVRLHGCYGESLWRLGTAGKDSDKDTGPGLYFEACKFEFSIKNQEFSPQYLVDYPGGAVVFRQSVLMGGYGFFLFNARLTCDDLCLRHPQSLIYDFSRSGDRLAQSFCGGVYAPDAGPIRLSPLAFFDHSGASPGFTQNRGLDGDALSIGDAEAARPIPWWTRQLDDGQSRWPIDATPQLQLDLETTPASLVVAQGAESILRPPSSLLDSLGAQGFDVEWAFGAGDFLFQPASGLAAYVVAKIATADGGIELLIRQVNRLRTLDHGVNFEPAERLRPNQNILHFISRRYYPAARRQMVETAADSPVMQIEAADGRPRKDFIGAGDFIVGAPPGSLPQHRLFATAKVSAVVKHMGSITLSRPARRHFWGDCPLFIKASR